MSDLERDKWPDEIRRIKDEMDMHAALKQRGWVVIALADGSPLDHAAYPTWNDAVKAAKWNRDNYMFLEIQPDGMTYREAHAVLDYARKLYDGGYRIPNPEWDAHMASTMPIQKHDRKIMLRQLISGKPLIPSDVPYGNLPNIGRSN